MPELSKTYAPAEVEPTVAAKWSEARAFAADPAAPGKPYCIVIPPPNVTAALHMGHALNNTLQDVLIRYHRMLGDNTLWMPGTDHAGIATQTVVEKRVLAERGKKRTDFERGEFVKLIQAWKDEYEEKILGQLKAMGCSCDWERTRFTMDDVCARAVREAFFRLFKDGLIYRGKRLVNWDPVTQTALADDEVENEEVDGHFYYLRYPLVDADGAPHVHAGLQQFITVATTRPETMLGDTAVAINPKDPRAAGLRGQFVRLPVVNRVIPIIEDDYVVLPVEFGGDEKDAKAQFATGFLKVTPAHDPNDYDLGQRHGLPIINVFSPTATVSKDHGWPSQEWDASGGNEADFLLGMDRFEARRAIVEWFRKEDLLENVRPYRHSVGHSYRSHVPIEPYLSDQWYVKVTDDGLRGAALAAMSQRSSSGGTGVPPVVGPQARSTPKRPVTTALHRHKRHLPHWQTGGSTYFVTFRVRQGQLMDAERDVVLSACLHWHGERAEVHLATVMPDHVHLLIQPARGESGQGHALKDLLHSIKSFSAHEINRLRNSTGPVWQEEYFDRIVRDEAEYLEKWNYIQLNPVKNGLVDQPEDYRWTWSGFEDSGLRPDDGRDARPTQTEGHAAQSTPWQGTLTFYPERYARTFETWHENIRDWCISRQLWWGHRIPVWSIHESHWVGSPEEAAQAKIRQQMPKWAESDRVAKFQRDPEHIGPVFGRGEKFEYFCVRDENDREVIDLIEQAGYTRDPDVLDTWFSSALWPFSTMGWPEPTAELAKWNPGNVLCTAREIITLWVSRMVMMNLYLLGRLPFTDVFIHAMIQDGEGRKMSKSLGNGVDPLDIIHSHGSDAMRFTLAKMTTNTQDVRMPVSRDPATGRNTSEKFDEGRNFANKVWNAGRFAMMKLEEARNATGAAPGNVDLNCGADLVNRWILSRLARAVRDTDQALKNYEFSGYAQGLYDFFWRDLCDWYIEAVKPTIAHNPVQQRVLALCLDASLRLMHPVMPFITEALWARLNEIVPQREISGVSLPASDLVIHAAWPKVAPELIDERAEQEFGLMQSIIAAVREIRTSYKVPPRQVVDMSAKAPPAIAQLMLAERALAETLTNGRGGEVGPKVERPADAAATVVGKVEVYVHGLVDADAERARLGKRVDELSKSIAALNGRLANRSYIDKAPAHLVQQTKDQLTAAEKEKAMLEQQLTGLRA